MSTQQCMKNLQKCVHKLFHRREESSVYFIDYPQED